MDVAGRDLKNLGYESSLNFVISSTKYRLKKYEPIILEWTKTLKSTF